MSHSVSKKGFLPWIVGGVCALGAGGLVFSGLVAGFFDDEAFTDRHPAGAYSDSDATATLDLLRKIARGTDFQCRPENAEFEVCWIEGERPGKFEAFKLMKGIERLTSAVDRGFVSKDPLAQTIGREYRAYQRAIRAGHIVPPNIVKLEGTIRFKIRSAEAQRIKRIFDEVIAQVSK